MQYSGSPPLHPVALHQLQTQIADANAQLKRGIDADWRASVMRYPEVLDYFYGLVELRLPNDRAPSVVEPPFAAAGYSDRGYEGSPGMMLQGPKKKSRKERGTTASPEMRHSHSKPKRSDEESYIVTGKSKKKAFAPPAPTPPIAGYGYGSPFYR
jgi:hypothetical protein